MTIPSEIKDGLYDELKSHTLNEDCGNIIVSRCCLNLILRFIEDHTQDLVRDSEFLTNRPIVNNEDWKNAFVWKETK